jgi:hypothetical protein
MNSNAVDALTRHAGALSRRSLLTIGLALSAGWLGAQATDAKKKRRRKKKRKAGCQPNCSGRTCGTDGCGGFCGACDADQVCHGGACCPPESRGATCAGRCGTWTNNCGQPVDCATCATGQVCLDNGSCAFACTDNNDCDVCSGSACSQPNVEGEQYCTRDLVQPLVVCTRTTDCPPRSHCQDIGPDGVVCVELCN